MNTIRNPTPPGSVSVRSGMVGFAPFAHQFHHPGVQLLAGFGLAGGGAGAEQFAVDPDQLRPLRLAVLLQVVRHHQPAEGVRRLRDDTGEQCVQVAHGESSEVPSW
jgi:hypothetical protein